jgi:hypothetical protein
MSVEKLLNDQQWVFIEEITADLKMTDRGLRKAIAGQRFPKPDGRLFKRNFWLRSTYNAWRGDVLAGKHATKCTLPGAR